MQEPAENLVLSNTIRSAVTAWAKSLATCAAKDNITVNNILTGNFYTERLRSLIEAEVVQSRISFQEAKSKWKIKFPRNVPADPQKWVT